MGLFWFESFAAVTVDHGLCSPDQDKLGRWRSPIRQSIGVHLDHAPQAGERTRAHGFECGVGLQAPTGVRQPRRHGLSSEGLSTLARWPAAMQFGYDDSRILHPVSRGSPDFVYAGVTYGQECWCDVALIRTTCLSHKCRGLLQHACKGDAKCASPIVLIVTSTPACKLRTRTHPPIPYNHENTVCDMSMFQSELRRI